MAICAICLRDYVQSLPNQIACSESCALFAGRAMTLAKQEKEQRKNDKARLESLKSITELADQAQTEFNKYVRLRDMHKPCVSCGQSPHVGQRHCSHFRPRSAGPQLRFNLFNCHASCAQCNTFKSGNLIPYRVELVRRIGEERVQALENNNELANYSREYLIRLKEVFARRTKHLKKLRARLSTDF
jgi:5-methylcytosine-specific restriction endonuclease McrA